MIRQIVLDTETTGLDPRGGHRIVEIACVEILDLMPTGKSFHRYVDPGREIDIDAQRVHGLTNAFLAGKPRFAEAEVADALLDFIGEAPVVAHNAAFDRGFLNHELSLAGRPNLDADRWVDTLGLAQRRFPSLSNSLDALCKRFKISLAERAKHGALVDARLLATVYLELNGGRERGLELEAAVAVGVSQTIAQAIYGARPRPLAPRLSAAEAAAHEALLRSDLAGGLWLVGEAAAADFGRQALPAT